jgi:hypothetical protein
MLYRVAADQESRSIDAHRIAAERQRVQEEVRRTSAEKERVQAEIYDAEIALAQKQAEVSYCTAGSFGPERHSFSACGQLERDIQEYHKVAAELKVIPSTGEVATPPARQNTTRWIRWAKCDCWGCGWLAQASTPTGCPSKSPSPPAETGAAPPRPPRPGAAKPRRGGFGFALPRWFRSGIRGTSRATGRP